MERLQLATSSKTNQRQRRRSLSLCNEPRYLFVTIVFAFVAFDCADTIDMSGQSAVQSDATSVAPENATSSGAKQAQLIELDETTAADWPAGCEELYRLQAHGEETAGDRTPYLVRGGADEIIQFYFDTPWRGDHQLLMARSVIDNRAIVHHWTLYTVENLQGDDAAILSSRSFLDVARVKDQKVVLGGGFNTEDVRLPDDVGLQMPTQANVGYLLEFHYFVPDEGTFQADASGVELCVTSKSRTHAAGSYGLGRDHFELPPHQATDVHASCTASDVSEPLHIVAIAPHMHATGTHAKLVLQRVSGEQIVLHDHPYNFDDQQVYWMGGADGSGVVVNDGDTLTTTCSYDNPRDTTILSGPTKDNEMCSLFTWAWPGNILINGQTKNGCGDQ